MKLEFYCRICDNTYKTSEYIYGCQMDPGPFSTCPRCGAQYIVPKDQQLPGGGYLPPWDVKHDETKGVLRNERR